MSHLPKATVMLGGSVGASRHVGSQLSPASSPPSPVKHAEGIPDRNGEGPHPSRLMLRPLCDPSLLVA